MNRAEKTARQRFDFDARLPDLVFRRSAELGFLFADSALLTADEGWGTLTACARLFGDGEVFAVVVDDLAGARTSTTPILSIESESPRELFIDWLDQEEVGRESPLFVDARVVAFAGASGRWGVWVEQDRELAVLGAPIHALGAIAASTLLARYWVPVRNVAELLAPSFHPAPVPRELLGRLNDGYGGSHLSLPHP